LTEQKRSWLAHKMIYKKAMLVTGTGRNSKLVF
jgi:hypothetical protein